MSSDLNKKIPNDSDVSLLADNLRYLMHEFKIDSSDLSKKTGIALTTVNALKRGAGNPTLSTLSQLAEFFNISIGKLTETNLSAKGNKNSCKVYELPLLTLDEFPSFLKDRTKYKNTISTELDSWKQEKYYAIKVTNNGMSPHFEKGTIFVIIRDDPAYDGDLVLVQFDKHTPCFRKVFIEGKSYFFKPVSEIIGDNTIKNNAFIIHGIVIKAIQNFHN